MASAFDPATLTSQQTQDILERIAKDSFIDLEKMKSLHILYGEDLFFMLFLLAGDEIRVPSMRALRKIYLDVVPHEATDSKEKT